MFLIKNNHQKNEVDNRVSGWTRLQGRKLLAARILYFTLFCLMIGLFVQGILAQLAFSTAGTIGVQVTPNPMEGVILSPIPGQPAESAGIHQGDVLLTINGEPIPARATRQVIHHLLMGPPGEPVTLDVRSQDGSQRLYSVTRDSAIVEQSGFSPTAYARYFAVLDILLVLGFCIPALIIFWRRSDDWLAMFVSLVLVTLAVGNSGELKGYYLQPDLDLPNIIFGYAYVLFILVMLYIFPDGRFIPGWTRWMVPVGIVWGSVHLLPTPYRPFSWPYFLGNLTDLALYGTGIYAQFYRYRYVSNPRERQQTKWVVFSMAVAYLGLYAYYWPQLFFPALQEPSLISFRYRILGQPLAYLAMLVLPLAFTFSILRYRLWEIDIILNRTLVYVPLTAVLTGLYSASITLSQKLFVAATGQKSDAAVVLTTLVMVSTFTPIKNSLQSIVDVRFKEATDPSKKMKALTEEVRSRIFHVDPLDITHRLLEEAIQVFEAKSGAIYWRKSGDLELLHAARDWDGDAQFSVPLIAVEGEAILGMIALSGRRNGSEYIDRDRRALEEAAHEVALAIEQDRKPVETL
jgi:hypothetical protein